MPLKLYYATFTDAPRIAEIYMAAFGSNALLCAQFPTPAVRAALQVAIDVLVIRDLREKDEGGVSMQEDEVNGKVISFSKWGHPVHEGEDNTEPMWVWPEGSNIKLLDEWAHKTDVAYKVALGQTPCYRLSFLGTDPLYERRGAASLMLQWGINQCKKDNALAYLESTVETRPLYEKNGFVRVEALSTSINGLLGDGSSMFYKEICFLFQAPF
ncbi:putative GNAT family acetyltransferase [Mollisia scopiformis]|uniref:Putative GNAT family acetyltransferase n=1 Tax=Mollisia scopiformis TaxID=149040 RepID=A0A132B1A7_MOLSC|nr:putative GNAT family acetyltransferase [Mollisia scopiformis]KUJ06156.1 putative GNAT family acetyltransferase [Mollisia scopiformis]